MVLCSVQQCYLLKLHDTFRIERAEAESKFCQLAQQTRSLTCVFTSTSKRLVVSGPVLCMGTGSCNAYTTLHNSAFGCCLVSTVAHSGNSDCMRRVWCIGFSGNQLVGGLLLHTTRSTSTKSCGEKFSKLKTSCTYNHSLYDDATGEIVVLPTTTDGLLPYGVDTFFLEASSTYNPHLVVCKSSLSPVRWTAFAPQTVVKSGFLHLAKCTTS